MSGYDIARGMSNNAVAAYESGLVPLSRINKKLLDACEIKESVKFVQWLGQNRYWEAEEWHHSGKNFYNEINFYNLPRLAEMLKKGELISSDGETTYNLSNVQAIYKSELEYTKEKQKTEVSFLVEGKYVVYKDSGKKSSIAYYQEFSGKKIGNWIYLDNGHKKKAYSNSIKWSHIKNQQFDVNHVLKSNLEIRVRAFLFGDDIVRNNKELALSLDNKLPIAVKSFGDILKKDIELAFRAVEINPASLKDLDVSFRKNKEVVLAAVKKDGLSLKFASEKLQDDKEIVLTAINSSGDAFKHASPRLLDDETVVQAAIKKSDFAINWISKRLQNNKEIVLEAVKKQGSDLEFASKELQNDKEVVFEAVKKQGSALEFASKELQNDKEVVLEAVKKQGLSLEYANKELQDDKEVVLGALQGSLICSPKILSYVSEQLRDDHDCVIRAVQEDGQSIKYASKRLQENEEIAKIAVQEDYLSLNYLSPKMRSNINVGVSAIENNSGAYDSLDQSLYDNPQIIKAMTVAIYKEHGENFNIGYYRLPEYLNSAKARCPKEFTQAMKNLDTDFAKNVIGKHFPDIYEKHCNQRETIDLTKMMAERKCIEKEREL